MRNEIENRYPSEVKILLDMIKGGIFLMVLYATIKLITGGLNLYLILSEVFIGAALYVLWRHLTKEVKIFAGEKDIDDAHMLVIKKQLVYTLVLLLFIHFFVVLYQKSIGLESMHLFFDYKLLILLVMLGLLSKKQGLIFFLPFFEKHEKKWFIMALLNYVKLFGLLMIFLTIYVFLNFLLLSGAIVLLYLFNVLLTSFILFVIHMTIYLTYEYVIYREAVCYQKSGMLSYTSKAALMFRLILLILPLMISVIFLYQAFLMQDQNMPGIALENNPTILFLGIWIASFQLIFYGVFFDGILKLKRPGNNNINIIIYIILGQFVVQSMIPFYGFIALKLGASSIITTFLGVLNLMIVVLMFIVGLMVYDYFHKQQFPKAIYFLFSILLQPTVYVFVFITSLMIPVEQIGRMYLINQLYQTLLLILTSALSLYAIYHMAFTKTKISPEL